MSVVSEQSPLWAPERDHAESTAMGALIREMGFSTYHELWRYSVSEPGKFWGKVWDDFPIIGDKGEVALVPAENFTGTQWFPEARLNYAENMLRRRDGGEALVFWGEDNIRRRLTYDDLYHEVARFQQFLISQGVGAGDRVAAYLPNLPETLIAMLATTALGAIWSSASPDFGAQGVLDRFGQIEPRILLFADGYWYAGKKIDCMAKNSDVLASIPTVKVAVLVEYLGESPEPVHAPNFVRWNDIPKADKFPSVLYYRCTFNHPLAILFSSGTTGVPKCIVHSHGGVLLQHAKEHRYHNDIRSGDRVFYFTTCGWMMWNWLMSALACDATLLLYDGSPFAKSGAIVFDFLQEERATHFGTSAKFIDAASKMGLVPNESHNLSSLRVLFSTGSPLAPESFDWVYSNISSNILLASISGGTDIVSCFVLGNPALPVYRGEIQCRGLGMDVDVFNDDGASVVGSKGELVCKTPFPSMPVGFWNDKDGSKYRAAYFERFPNVWCHGDYAEITAHSGVVIYGRSDATLNPGGVRIGTAEIYRQVEKLAEVEESIVIGQEWPPERKDDVRVVLFVKLRPGVGLSDALVDRIKGQIRNNTTPRHVPAKVLAVTDIPRTKSGKLVELAVRNIVHGLPVKNKEALANPEALALFANLADLTA